MIKFDAVNNFRDYGGWRTTDGKRVVSGKLFRSAHLARATAADLERIGQLGIATVTDLRHRAEQREQPGAWIGKLPLKVIEEPDVPGAAGKEAPHLIAFRESDFSPDAMRSFMTRHYGEMPYEARHIVLFSRYFDALASTDGGILIHCAAGKDRTGILAALTHHALRVHPDDIMEDFLLTNQAGNIAERLPRLRKQMERSYGRAIPDGALKALLTVHPDYIARMWSAIAERSGSVDSYLQNELGMNVGKLARIRARFVA